MSIRWVLVDGYSVLHAWPRFTAKKSGLRTLHQRRDALIRLLRQYADQTGRRVTVVFDAHSAKHSPGADVPETGLEVWYSKKAQSADEMIERSVAESPHRASILVVTSDHLERSLVEGFGAQSISAAAFEPEMQIGLDDLAGLVRQHGHRKRSLSSGWPQHPPAS